ncbi:MAG: serpin family protein [Myxococcales bacterium]|nr:serpin family protein [Myxococcales bacterium]
MPYSGGSLAMTVVLPDAKDGLAALEKSLSLDVYKGWSAAVSKRRRKVEVAFPKFEIANAKLPLKDALKTLGMKLAFDLTEADFTKMANPANDAEKLYIFDAFHKAFIKVDEKGTEAAAATAVVMAVKGAAPAPPPKFMADHPFLFAIEDTESGAILFMGRVLDPH